MSRHQRHLVIQLYNVCLFVQHPAQYALIALSCVQFLSRPFVVGDRVELSSGGGERVMVGVIERVDPMRTIIRTDASLPVTIPNKVVIMQ